jgi:hypothetical protein
MYFRTEVSGSRRQNFVVQATTRMRTGLKDYINDSANNMVISNAVKYYYPMHEDYQMVDTVG